ncbi:MAG: serine/threonine-protein phosphatase [Eubacteriales bacterium]|nr:serine/threonine-protein phosphatase [Eubacteriales bacterium]
MSYQIEYACVCENGKVRMHNEDNFWCKGAYLPSENTGTRDYLTGNCSEDKKSIFAVFDGMGGESHGEMASYLSAKSLDEFYYENQKLLDQNPEKFLEMSCKSMNTAVCDFAKNNKIRSMGSTVAMAAIDEKKIYVSNLGDSRVYWYHDGELLLLTTDHVMKRGLFGKPPLVQYLGIEEKHMILEPSIKVVEHSENDALILCSDGVTDMLTESEMSNMLAEELPDQKRSMVDIAHKIVELALERGGRDNTTLIICRVKGKTREHIWKKVFRKLREK